MILIIIATVIMVILLVIAAWVRGYTIVRVREIDKCLQFIKYIQRCKYMDDSQKLELLRFFKLTFLPEKNIKIPNEKEE